MTWNVKKIKDYFAVSVLLLVLFQLVNSFTSLELVGLLKLTLTVSVVLAALVLWRDADSIFGNLEKQKKSELAEENKPSSRNYLLALVAIFFAGILFRLVEVEIIGIYADEFSSLIAAMGLVDHGLPNYVKNGELIQFYADYDTFPRAYFLLWTTATLFEWFGQSLLVARLQVIILTAATAIPIYFVGKQINRRVGLIAAFVWLISPWALMIGKLVREYAFFPLFYLILFLIFVWLANYLLAVFEKRKRMSYSMLALGSIAVIFPLVYAFILDPLSTFQQVIVPYFTALLYIIYMFLSSKRIRRQMKIRILSVMALLVIAGASIIWWGIPGDPNLDLTSSFTWVWVDIIFLTNPRQWFFETGAYLFYLIFAVGALGSIMTLVKGKFPVIFFYALTFLTYLYAYTFHFARYGRPRYGFVMHVWMIPIIAFGVYLLYLILRDQKTALRKWLATITLAVMLLLTFNPVNTYKAIYTEKIDGFNRVAEEYLFRFDAVHEKYGEEFRDSAILCSTCGPLYWFGTVDLMDNKVNTFSFNKGKMFGRAMEIVEENEHGWMILDEWRFREQGLPFEDLDFQGNIFVFVEKINGFYIYKW